MSGKCCLGAAETVVEAPRLIAGRKPDEVEIGLESDRCPSNGWRQ